MVVTRDASMILEAIWHQEERQNKNTAAVIPLDLESDRHLGQIHVLRFHILDVCLTVLGRE